jgi:hypothetical protein
MKGQHLRLARLMAAAVLLIAAGCTQPGNDSRFETGAGLSLHTPDTAKATKDLQDYYRALCAQANPLSGSETDPVVQCGSLNVMVRAGFNDIDLRCDRYLAWIDRKRIEASTFKTGLAATNTLLTGVITGGADTLRYIAQVFGFATTIYDSYNNALLMGLEGSTIKKLVYERRRAYRKEFTQINYTNYADATYALRGYLRICTPQTIMLSANDYALAGISGVPVATPAAIARQEREVLQPTKPEAPANRVPTTRAPRDPCPACATVFASPYDKSREPRHVREVQERLCVGTVADRPDSTALAKLRVYDMTNPISKPADGLITSRTEFSALESNGCRPGERANEGYRSVFERKKFTEGSVTDIVANMNAVLEKNSKPQIPAGSGPASSEFRNAIVEIRGIFGDDFNDTFLTEQEEFTAALENEIILELRRP